MNTLKDIVDDLIRSVESIRTDSAKFPDMYLADLCDQYRANAIATIYESRGRIHPAWVQKYVPDFDKDMQDDNTCVKFMVPAPITLGNYQNGLVYTGTLDGKKNFKRVLSQAEYATYEQHRHFNGLTEQVLVEGIEGDEMILKVMGNPLLTELRTDGVWSKPTKLSTFNYEFDMYPLCDEGIVIMKGLMLKSQLLVQEQTPADLKQDEKPAVSIPNK